MPRTLVRDRRMIKRAPATPFAARSSEGTIISRRSESSRDPGVGMPFVSESTVAAIASFTVDAAGKRAFAFQAAPDPPVRLCT